MTRRGKPGPVVVGVDEAGSAEDAVDWATAEAAARGCPLRVVHAFRPPLPADAYGFASPIDSFVTAHTAAQLILGDAVTRARSVAPGIEVSTRLVRGTAARALLGEARDARLLVLGSRGRSGLRAVLSGSVAGPVSRHSPCPIVVIRPFANRPRPGLPAVGPPCRRGYRPRRIPLRRDRFRLPRRISTGHTAHRPVGMDTGHGGRHRDDPRSAPHGRGRSGSSRSADPRAVARGIPDSPRHHHPRLRRPGSRSDRRIVRSGPPGRRILQPGPPPAGSCAARSAERSCATPAARSPSSVVTGRLRVGRPRAGRPRH